MATFQELFCEKNSCSKEEFGRRVLKLSLYPHAALIAPALRLLSGEFFAPDLELVASAGRAVDMKSVRESVRDFYWAASKRGWLHRICYLRVSGQRLKNLARHYLPEGKTVPPFADA